MGKKFETDMTVVRFGAEDVIATSGAKTVALSGMGNQSGSDNQLTFVNYSFTYGTPGVSSGTVRNALADYFEDPGMAKQTVSNIKFENGSSTSNLNILWGGQSNTDEFNGTFVYNGAGTYTFTKQ